MSKKIRNFRDIARKAALAADEKKAGGIVILDIRKESDVADYVVIAGADSSAQMKAIRASVTDSLENEGLFPLRQDGLATGRWLVLDYGGVVVHILIPQARNFFRLESLWEKAKTVKWDEV